MENKYIVSFSGGKDSTAMLLLLKEKGYPIDEVIFCDTGVEFPEVYEHIEKVKQNLGIEITVLTAEYDYEYYMFNYKKKKGKKKGERGYSFPDFRNRWCTQVFKKNIIKWYMQEKYKDYHIIEYHGIASDEPKRLLKNNEDERQIKYPLNEWGMTEADCLEYCYDQGYDWGGLYRKFERVSCWCCPLSRIREVRVLYHEYPELWAKLEEWQLRTYRSFRPDYTIQQLGEKFKKEDASGKRRK